MYKLQENSSVLKVLTLLWQKYSENSFLNKVFKARLKRKKVFKVDESSLGSHVNINSLTLNKSQLS